MKILSQWVLFIPLLFPFISLYFFFCTFVYSLLFFPGFCTIFQKSKIFICKHFVLVFLQPLMTLRQRNKAPWGCSQGTTLYILCCDDKMCYLCDLLVSSTSPASWFQIMCIRAPVTSSCTLFLLLQTRDSNFVLQTVDIPLEKCTQRSGAWGILTVHSPWAPIVLPTVSWFRVLVLPCFHWRRNCIFTYHFSHWGDWGEKKS